MVFSGGMAKLSPTARLLKELVAIPSVNPDGDPGTDGVGEEEVALFVAEYLRRAGADVKLRAVRPGRPNVLGVFRPAGRVRRRVLLAPHLDTVSVRGMTVDPFRPVVKGGRLYGRGSCDTKGPMASMLVALAEAAGKGFPEGVELTFAGLMDEEAGHEGAVAHVKESLRKPFDLVIVGEPTDLKIVAAHKGTSWFYIREKGRPAHASMPRLGKNAILSLQPRLARAVAFLEKEFARYRHPKLGRPTFNVGTVSGGTKFNIVPDECRVGFDVRYLPGMEMEAILKRLAREVRPAQVELERTFMPMDTDAGHPLVRAIRPATLGVTTAPWFCDGAFYAQEGMAAVALGPGSIAQAHTKDEFIELAELDKGTEMFRGVISRLAVAARG